MSARDVVLSLLRRWRTPSDPPFVPERSDETFASLAPRDRPFAFDLITGVIRWRASLDAVIASRLKQPLDMLDHNVKAVLWLGTYQLLFQGGTSDYAAVDTTVALAKKHRDTAQASGLVNAVLRGITRLQPTLGPRTDTSLSRRSLALDLATQLTFAEDIFLNPQANPIGHLAAVRSHPAPYVQHLRDLFGQSQASELLLRNNVRPVITLRADVTSLDISAAAGLVAHADALRFLVAAQGWNPHVEALVANGTLSPQDPTAARPVRAAAELAFAGEARVPAKILDLCAGLGTKTVQVARAFPNATIWAADTDSVKLARLQQRAAQLKLQNVKAIPAQQLAGTLERYDLVLVDVPCSNTGVFSKRVQSRWRWPTLDRQALSQLQNKLFQQGAALAESGGTLLYSTCSIDPAENAELVKKNACSVDIRLHLLQEQGTLPSLTPGDSATHDGGYFAVLRKS